jgi:hypothetical protein
MKICFIFEQVYFLQWGVVLLHVGQWHMRRVQRAAGSGASSPRPRVCQGSRCCRCKVNTRHCSSAAFHQPVARYCVGGVCGCSGSSVRCFYFQSPQALNQAVEKDEGISLGPYRIPVPRLIRPHCASQRVAEAQRGVADLRCCCKNRYRNRQPGTGVSFVFLGSSFLAPGCARDVSCATRRQLPPLN